MYNKKLELLSKELEATMNHASEVMDEIIATAIEQALMEAIDNLSDAEKMVLLLDVLDAEMENNQPKQIDDELVELFVAMNKAVAEQESKKKVVNFDDELMCDLISLLGTYK
jgi:F0F1-type ATP synthase membrane subunit b/b'